MPATEGEIKLVARITALEILAQHLICLACTAISTMSAPTASG